MLKSYKLKGNNYIDSSSVLHNKMSIKKYLDNNLKFTPVFSSAIVDSQTKTVAIDSSLESCLLFINTHINIREIYMITYYATVTTNVDTILRSSEKDYTHFAINGNVLTISAASNCRGFLYRVNMSVAS